jgi:hypothetical protein
MSISVHILFIHFCCVVQCTKNLNKREPFGYVRVDLRTVLKWAAGHGSRAV